ncbi:MAG TPA: hypothetical protein VGF54_05815 [Streptosporangiaceae bacterium]
MVPGSVLRHRYRLDGCIALGGVGEVWRGTDLVLGRVVAVKLLRPEYAQDEECLARFRAEGRHAALLSHPNIAQVYDYVEKAPPLAGFLVMELVDGQSLARLLAGGPPDPARTMGIIAQAAGARRRGAGGPGLGPGHDDRISAGSPAVTGYPPGRPTGRPTRGGRATCRLPSPTGAGGDGPRRSAASAQAHRPSLSSPAPSSPAPSSPSPTSTPPLPLPTPSLPLPTPSLPLPA